MSIEVGLCFHQFFCGIDYCHSHRFNNIIRFSLQGSLIPSLHKLICSTVVHTARQALFT